jgi:hypothetical protein
MRRQNLPRNICFPLLLLFLMTLGVAQEKHRRIGEIDFYGYAGLDLEKIRAALPVREGDELAGYDNAVLTLIGRMRETVKRVVGKPATDVAAVCCDAEGNAMFYIGLPGSSMRTLRFSPPPKGRACRDPMEGWASISASRSQGCSPGRRSHEGRLFHNASLAAGRLQDSATLASES